MNNKLKYYVYKAIGVNGEILYIGKGTGARLRHCNSGTSHCLELNRYYFENGENSIVVEKLKSFETDDEAIRYERFCITTLKPLFNKDFNVDFDRKDYRWKTMNIEDKLKAGYVVDFSKVMKLYLSAHKKCDNEFISIVDQYSPEHKNCLDVLGVDKIKRIGYNKTKIMKAYNLKVSVERNYHEIKQNLSGVFVGERYALSNIITLLQNAYDKVNIDKKPKSTDIKNFFSVKEVFVTKDGKRNKGYLILDDLYKDNI